MSLDSCFPPLLLWLAQAAVGGTFYIAVLARHGVESRFFAAHSLVLASFWLAISCALGLTDNYLCGFSFICLIAAWRFRKGDLTGGKSWLLLAAALGALFGLLRFVVIAEDYSIWLKLWMLVSVYIGVFTMGILYLSLAIVFAPADWIDDPHYASTRTLLPLEQALYIRALYQIASLLAIPMIAEKQGVHFLASITGRSGLLAITWITGLLLPLMLLFHDEDVEPFTPQQQRWRFLILGFSASFSVLVGAQLFL